jgi:5-methylcytosine-specific restriction endonuclease McrA
VYKQTNKETILIHANARRKRCRESQPSWADVDRIREVYALTATKTRITGIKHHVDHIIPLNGKHVCGLHVHENLQILTKEENLSKGNKHS